MKATTTSSNKIWESSDGQRKIWEVTIKADDGNDYRLKTYSEKIGTEGFEGELETYLNPKGDRFVRQPKQEGGGYKGGGGNNKNQPIIQTQWAIGQARQFVNARGGGVIQDDDTYWAEVKKTAVTLVLAVDDVMAEVARQKAQ